MPQETLIKNARAALKRMQEKDPGLNHVINKAYGHAIFPEVGKASLVVGGSYGRGVVFERRRLAGYATISELTLGVQVGGETFSELIIFESKEVFDRFKRGKTSFAADAAAVLVKAGAASSNDFENGAAVYVNSEGGMLLELAIGGQKFSFKPARGEAAHRGKAERGSARSGAKKETSTRSSKSSPRAGGSEKSKRSPVHRAAKRLSGSHGRTARAPAGKRSNRAAR